MLKIIYGIAIDPLRPDAITCSDPEIGVRLQEYTRALLVLDNSCVEVNDAEAEVIDNDVESEYMAALNLIRSLFSMDRIHCLPPLKEASDVKGQFSDTMSRLEVGSIHSRVV
ncbi:uncharacterized protein [Antedon mediterranea]|uniref:uncharacterized protein n=1 Tax=Antedon mediterranea TaxID=105859 RepID=UPI003AF9D40F